MFFQGHDLMNCSPYSYILSLKSSQLISKLSWLNFHPGINVICMSGRWQFRRQPVSSLGSSDKHSNWMTELSFKVSWAQRWASQGLMLMSSIQFLRRAIRALMRWGPWASVLAPKEVEKLLWIFLSASLRQAVCLGIVFDPVSRMCPFFTIVCPPYIPPSLLAGVIGLLCYWFYLY